VVEIKALNQVDLAVVDFLEDQQVVHFYLKEILAEQQIVQAVQAEAVLAQLVVHPYPILVLQVALGLQTQLLVHP
jgi:hypothetical protein